VNRSVRRACSDFAASGQSADASRVRWAAAVARGRPPGLASEALLDPGRIGAQGWRRRRLHDRGWPAVNHTKPGALAGADRRVLSAAQLRPHVRLSSDSLRRTDQQICRPALFQGELYSVGCDAASNCSIGRRAQVRPLAGLPRTSNDQTPLEFPQAALGAVA